MHTVSLSFFVGLGYLVLIPSVVALPLGQPYDDVHSAGEVILQSAYVTITPLPNHNNIW